MRSTRFANSCTPARVSLMLCFSRTDVSPLSRRYFSSISPPFVDVTALKRARGGRDLRLRKSFADVDVETAQQLPSGRDEIVEPHFPDALAPPGTHRPIPDQLPRVLPDEGVECRADVLQTARRNGTTIQIVADRRDDASFEFAEVVSRTARRAIGEPPQNVVELAADEQTIDDSKIKAIKEKTRVSRVVEALLQGWLDGTIKLPDEAKGR
jgi:hypothetical protein